MMKIRNPMSIVATLLLACSTLAMADPTVQQLADRWADAYNDHDQKALGAVYTDSAHLYMHGSSRLVGREAIEDFWASDFEVDNPLTLLKVTHSVQGVDTILVHGDYEVVSREDGAMLGSGRFAHIWLLNEEGEWHLDRDLWNQPYKAVE